MYDELGIMEVEDLNKKLTHQCLQCGYPHPQETLELQKRSPISEIGRWVVCCALEDAFAKGPLLN